MKRIRITLFPVIFPAIATIALAASAAAQVVVVGTGNPSIDVPAVQAAVNQGGDIILQGHFSFQTEPTVPIAKDLLPWGYPQAAMVLVSKAVAISGTRGDDGEMTTIEGGITPFYVEALGVPVSIQRLRFVRPKAEAVLINAVSGLTIASCKIEKIESLPSFGGAFGIAIDTSGGIPSPTHPGRPENVSGTLLIVNNDIEFAGSSATDDIRNGFFIFSAGVPGAEVEAYVSGNNIKNTTTEAIMFRRISGRVYVERNAITTASVAVSTAVTGQIDVIRAVNIGSYLIASNTIDCRYPQTAGPAITGIAVFSQFADWPMERAIVVDNDVTMTPPEGTVFGPLSAGINIRGFAQSNVALNNRVRGRARAALAVDVFRGGIPGNNSFVLNGFDDFEASRAGVFVDVGVTNTLVAGRIDSVEDHGLGTNLLPLPLRGDDEERHDQGKDHRR